MSTTGWMGQAPKVSPQMKKICEPVGTYLPTVEELIRTNSKYAEHAKVGVVYLHPAYCEDSFYVGCSEDYKIRKNATDKKRFISTQPLLLLLTSNIFAVEKAICDALDTDDSVVTKLSTETYEQFYDRVIGAFAAYEHYSVFNLTTNFARFISHKQFLDWSKNDYAMENDKYLYLDNPIVEELETDTHWHWGYEALYEVEEGRTYLPYLRLPSNMRIKHHKLKQCQKDKEDNLATYLTVMHKYKSKRRS